MNIPRLAAAALAAVAVLAGTACSTSPEDQAWELCQDLIKDQTGGSNFKFGEYTFNEVGGGYWVNGQVEFENRLGETKSHKANCRIDPTGDTEDMGALYPD